MSIIHLKGEAANAFINAAREASEHCDALRALPQSPLPGDIWRNGKRELRIRSIENDGHVTGLNPHAKQPNVQTIAGKAFAANWTFVSRVPLAQRLREPVTGRTGYVLVRMTYAERNDLLARIEKDGAR